MVNFLGRVRHHDNGERYVYLLPPDGEEFSTAQINNSGPITLGRLLGG
jgi:hypothetical protein